MNRSIREQLDGVHLKPLKASLHPDTGNLKFPEDAAAIIVCALLKAGIAQKEAAITMGISEAQFTRQLRGQEHLSFQRLCKLPDAFFRELLVVIAERRRIATVTTHISLRTEVA